MDNTLGAKSKPFTDQRLAKNLSTLWAVPENERPIFDVVIVGSGYGASAAAFALANSKESSVCLLERGREYLAGEFPASFDELPRHLRSGQQSTGQVVGNHEGLFDVRLGDDVVALVANGLGGGSLINAGVMIEPDPQHLRERLQAHGVDEAALGRNPFLNALTHARKAGLFQEARRMVGAEVKREGVWRANTIERHRQWRENGPLRKSAALSELARASGLRADPTSVSVAMDPEPNAANVRLNPCTLCGDCMTGCNVGAKDSLDVNLLRQARGRKVEMFTGAAVLSIKRSDPAHASERHWVLRVAHTDPHQQRREPSLLFVRARKVVLAAGALGSPEILLRSRDDKLVFSPRLGEGFSCNGDNLAAAHDLAGETGIGASEDEPIGGRCVGPTITSTIEVARPAERERFHVQEFAVPGAMKRLFDEIVSTAHVLHALPNADTTRHGGEAVTEIDPLAVDPARMARTLLVGVIGHDEARGSLRLANPVRPKDGFPQQGALNIYWPEARFDRSLDVAHAQLADMVRRLPTSETARAVKPILVANPMWRLLPPALENLVAQPRGPVLTVHPLGGCGMGEDVWSGVVDDLGRVFNGDHGGSDDWFGSLVVLDGSIVPQSLGVNPALTITALTLRAMKHHCDAWGQKNESDRQIGGDQAVDRPMLSRATVPPPLFEPCKETHVEVIERLRGPVALGTKDPSPRWMAELTLAYHPRSLRSLTSTLSRSVDVDPANPNSRLRIYAQADWQTHQLAVASDATRAQYVKADVRIGKGTLSLLHREPSTPWQRRWRALVAWLLNRGMRDTWQSFVEAPSQGTGVKVRAAGGPVGKLQEISAKLRGVLGKLRSLVSKLRELWDLASHAGEVRRFDYRVELGEVVLDRLEGGDGKPLGIDFTRGVIEGSKRLTYDRRANPWRQLTRLTLTRMPGLLPGSTPVLNLDLRFLVGQGVPLIQIRKQRNQAHALGELASFALYFARLLISIHLWTFRKPDTPSLAEPVRLPDVIVGLPAPVITELLVDRMKDTGQPVLVRLTRYQANSPSAKAPLVMIHGYSVSGTTFTHPSLRPSAAEYFWHKGRDVWIVDLRTSSGMPTAAMPWSMEQAALIDIPAALLHIRKATGQKVDVLAHCIGCAMLSMAILTDARSVRSSETQLGVSTWLSSEHLGTLTAFNEPLGEGAEHPCIRTITLSQKGPVLRYTDGNVLRAFIMQYARRWLLSDDYQFRRSSRPTVSEDLLDRLLSSVPYPDEDYDVENPLQPWATTPWTCSRHRMDALYGRDFSADNVSDETLRAIDDLFGPMNMDTVSQTIHFARFNAITNQRGRGEFVTRRRLRDRWSGIPTLLLHGKQNGLADVSTHALLEEAFRSAQVPFHSVPPYERMGHQDVLIGLQSGKVFDDVEAFLSCPPSRPQSSASAGAQLVCDIPWIGPRIDLYPDVGRADLRIGCRSRPDQGRGTLFLVPASLDIGSETYKVEDLPKAVFSSAEMTSSDWLFVDPDLTAFRNLPQAHGTEFGWLALIVHPIGESANATDHPLVADATAKDLPLQTPSSMNAPSPGEQRKRDPSSAAIKQDVSSDSASPPTWPSFMVPGGIGWYSHIAVMKLKIGELVLESPGLPGGLRNLRSVFDVLSFDVTGLQTGSEGPAAAPTAEELQAQEVAQAILDMAREWLQVFGHERSVVSLCFVRLNDLQKAETQRQAALPADGLRFSLASCQYPQGLLDRPVAQSSLRLMTQQLDRLDGALFVGDQIYADATAGLVDPVRRDELYDHPHDNAFRVPPMREINRRVPSYFLLDDHELCDNWEPLTPGVKRWLTDLNARNEEIRKNGLRAFRSHQRMRRFLTKNGVEMPADYDFTIKGYPFRMLDTRSGRSSESAGGASKVSILSDEQWSGLEAWLEKRKEHVKFLATPSVLLPRRRSVAEGVELGGRGDSWDAFPSSLRRVLGLIVESERSNTVFLSGDEHHAFCAEIWVRRHDEAEEAPSVKIVSIHTSALYAPFPFANGRPHDFVENDAFVLDGLSVQVRTTFAPPGDGFATVEVSTASGQPMLHVGFEKSGDSGGAGHALSIPLGDQPPGAWQLAA